MLDHLPISMIKKTGTPARYMAIAAPERMDLVPISDLRMPSFVSPIATTPSRHKSAIISPVIGLGLGLGQRRLDDLARVASPNAPFELNIEVEHESEGTPHVESSAKALGTSLLAVVTGIVFLARFA